MADPLYIVHVRDGLVAVAHPEGAEPGMNLEGCERYRVPASFGAQLMARDWPRRDPRALGELTWDMIRLDRKSRLDACDWTQTRDQDDAVSALWAPYRRALRELPGDESGDPNAVVWPVPPAA